MRRAAILLLYTVVFWMVLPVILAAASAAADRWVGIIIPSSLLLGLSGLLLFALSATLLVISVIQFRRFAGEWPVSALPSERLARRGLYAAWRHPIYLFYTLALVGAGILLRSAGMLLVVFPVFAVLVAAYAFIEERGAVQRFGESYRHYRTQTGVVIPRFPYGLRGPLWILFKILFHFRAEHRERIPAEPPFFVVSTHRNYLDPFYIALAIDFPVRFLTTHEVFRKPVSAFFFRKLLSIPRKRYSPDAASIRATVRAVETDSVVGIFPEGERSWTGRPGPIKPEVLKLLLHCHRIPVLPVRIEGNFHAWPRWAASFRRAPVRVVFQEPLCFTPGQSVDAAEALLASAIRPDDRGAACKSLNRAAGLDRVLYRCHACRLFNAFRMTRGTVLRCSGCGLRLTVTETMSLCDDAGKEQSIHDVYTRIRITADDWKASEQDEKDSSADDAERRIAESEGCIVFREKGRAMAPYARGRLRLTDRRLGLEGAAAPFGLRLSDIGSVTVESNRKLQVYDRTRCALWQVVFERESVLQWQDWLAESVRAFTGRTPNRS